MAVGKADGYGALGKTEPPAGGHLSEAVELKESYQIFRLSCVLID